MDSVSLNLVAFVFYILLFFACSALSGVVIYLQFFAEKVKNPYQFGHKVSALMLFFLFLFTIFDGGGYFRGLLK